MTIGETGPLLILLHTLTVNGYNSGRQQNIRWDSDMNTKRLLHSPGQRGTAQDTRTARNREGGPGRKTCLRMHSAKKVSVYRLPNSLYFCVNLSLRPRFLALPVAFNSCPVLLIVL